MELYIDNKSGAPIYDQIYTQIKDQIIQGALQPDEAMPSIRGLARDLRISVITTKRAYDELEKEGFLYAVPAKGFFVAPKNTELLREENLKGKSCGRCWNCYGRAEYECTGTAGTYKTL